MRARVVADGGHSPRASVDEEGQRPGKSRGEAGLLTVLKNYVLLLFIMVTTASLAIYYFKNVSKPSTQQKMVWEAKHISRDVERTADLFEKVKREVGGRSWF
eukprot:2420713-Pyramimonas_sp.AAC.1